MFLCLLPTQLGKHFWPGWSLISGIRVDYLAPTIYLVDIIVIMMIISKITITKFQETNNDQIPITKKQTKKKILLFIVFILIHILV